MKKYTLGTLLGGLSLFLLGYLTYAILLPNHTFDGAGAAAASRAAPMVPQIIVAELLFGFLLTHALTASGAIANAGSSLITGAMTGGLIALGFSLVIHADTTVMAGRGVLFMALTWAVRWALAGGILSLVLGKQSAAAPAATAAG